MVRGILTKPSIASVALLCALCQHSTWAIEFDLLETGLPVVLSPTRLKQSLADVPGSVTIISADMMSSLGIRSVPDALRLVPGMAVTQVTGDDYRINYHGTSILTPRRMNVLVDGISVYRPSFARVDWRDLPIAMEDIDRIEVTRGPNSASYGANSMMAIINIISKHPAEVQATTLKTTVGTDKSNTETIRWGGRVNETTVYRATGEYFRDKGFSHGASKDDSHDTTRVSKMTFRSNTDIGPDESIELQAMYVGGRKNIRYVDAYQSTYPDIDSQDLYLDALWRKSLDIDHDIKIQAYYSRHESEQDWRTCPPTAMFLPQMYALWQSNKQYVYAILRRQIPSGGTPQDDALAVQALVAIAGLGANALKPTCVTANQNYVESRADIEVQDTYVFTGNLRMVSGLGLREDVGSSQTYLGGTERNRTWRAFANVEFKALDRVLLNLGGFYERDSLTGSLFSPRAAVNFRLSDNHTLRFVESRAQRKPDIQEQRANWSYYSTNFSKPLNGATEGYFFQSAISHGNLRGEKMRSQEIGILSNFPDLGLLVDAKIFSDKMTGLISEKLQLTEYLPTNSNSVKLTGAEVQASYAPNDRWSVNIGYSHLNTAPSIEVEKTQYARKSGSIAVSHLWDSGWRTSLAYYGYAANSTGQTPYGREDLTLMKSYKMDGGSALTTSLTLSYLNYKHSSYLVDEGKIRDNYFKHPFECYLSLKLTY